MLIVSLLACTGEVVDPEPTGLPEPTADTGEPDPMLVVPNRMGLTLAFVIDDDGVSFVDGVLPTGEVTEPFFQVSWSEATDGPVDPTRACLVDVSLQGLQLEVVDPPDPHPFRLVLPADVDAAALCPSDEFDLSFFFDDDPVTASLPPVVPWTFEWGGPPSPTLGEWLTPQDQASIDVFAGATITSPLVISNVADQVYARAFEVDEERNLVIRGGAPVSLPREALVRPDGTAANAAWAIVIPWLLIFEN